MTRKLMLAVNPNSGRGLSKSTIGTIVSELCADGNSVTVFFTKPGQIESLIIQNCQNFDLVICAGGDGTLSGVVSGLLLSDKTLPLGYIPTGTANDVATTLELSKNPQTAARAVLEGKPFPFDAGIFQNTHFTYIAAFGAFTGVSYQTKQSAKKALGQMAYIFAGIASVAEIAPKHTIVEYDGNTIEGDFIFGSVSNSTSVASLVKLDPEHVNLADGSFEIILVKQPINLMALTDILTSIVRKTYNGDNVIMLHASNVKFSFDKPVAWTRDGEPGGHHQSVSIENLHKAITFIK